LDAQVAVQANSAVGREKSQLESRAQKAKAKLDAAKEKVESAERAPLPKIEASVRGLTSAVAELVKLLLCGVVRGQGGGQAEQQALA
jgi:hypothetical protein